MKFYYEDYAMHGMDYPESFSKYKTIDTAAFNEMDKLYDKEGTLIERTFEELKRRTTEEYFDKVERAQRKAWRYSNKVFPAYKFIMPDALADDWLSTVDWHKRYPARDHSLHQTLTAYIVNRLLGGGNVEKAFPLKRSTDSNLLDYCASRILESPSMHYLLNYYEDLNPGFSKQHITYKRRWAKDVFYEAAMIAALFHDMGYPWQYINSLKAAIKAADNGLSNDPTGSAAATFEAIKNRLLVYPFFGYSESNLKHPTQALKELVLTLIDCGLRQTHGLPGALGFMTLNDRIRDYGDIRHKDDANYRLILDWAAVAIMMHDMAKIYWNEEKKKPRYSILRQSFEVDPLSSLISLADILEEFQRPSAMFGKELKAISAKGDKDEVVNLSYHFPCVASEMQILGRQLQITYYYQEERTAALEFGRRNDEVNQYLNTSDGFIDIINWGVKDVKCFTKALPKDFKDA